MDNNEYQVINERQCWEELAAERAAHEATRQELLAALECEELAHKAFVEAERDLDEWKAGALGSRLKELETDIADRDDTIADLVAALEGECAGAGPSNISARDALARAKAVKP